MGFLTNKRALVTGIISDRSIASGIAETLSREGAELIVTYQNEKFKERVGKIASAFNTKVCLPCDVSNDDEIAQLMQEVSKHWDGFDILIHSIAYAPSDQLQGSYVDSVTREGFRIAHDISSYSFAALAKAAHPLMQNRAGTASMLTLSYLGSQRTFPSYNVMGIAKASLEANMRYLAASLGPKNIRVNAISAGPIRTLAASGVKNFRKILSYDEKTAPLRRSVTIEEVGNAAAFLSSDLAAGVAGQILYVDAGFNIIGIADSLFDESA